MTNSKYEYLTTLQYREKNLKVRLEAFENGDIYKKMEEDYKSLLHTEKYRIRNLEKDLSKANAKMIRTRNCRFKVLDDTCDQVRSFRSYGSIDYPCQSMNMLLSMRKESDSGIYDSVSRFSTDKRPIERLDVKRLLYRLIKFKVTSEQSPVCDIFACDIYSVFFCFC